MEKVCRFRPVRAKKIRLGIALGVVSLALLLYSLSLPALLTSRHDRGAAVVVGVTLVLIFIWSILKTRNRVEIDRHGMRVFGTLRFVMPGYTPWNSVAGVFCQSVCNGSIHYDVLTFRLENGRVFSFGDRDGSRERYVSLETEATLRQSIEQYGRSIEMMPGVEPRLTRGGLAQWSQDAVRSAYLAIAVTVLAVVGMVASPVYALLPWHTRCGWIAGALGLFLAVYRLRKARKKPGYWTALILSTGSGVLAGFMIAGALPYWLGQSVSIQFAIDVENDQKQVWRSPDGDVLILRIEPEKRRFKGVGIDIPIPVLQFGMLRAVPRGEYHVLRIHELPPP